MLGSNFFLLFPPPHFFLYFFQPARRPAEHWCSPQPRLWCWPTVAAYATGTIAPRWLGVSCPSCSCLCALFLSCSWLSSSSSYSSSSSFSSISPLGTPLVITVAVIIPRSLCSTSLSSFSSFSSSFFFLFFQGRAILPKRHCGRSRLYCQCRRHISRRRTAELPMILWSFPPHLLCRFLFGHGHKKCKIVLRHVDIRINAQINCQVEQNQDHRLASHLRIKPACYFQSDDRFNDDEINKINKKKKKKKKSQDSLAPGSAAHARAAAVRSGGGVWLSSAGSALAAHVLPRPLRHGRRRSPAAVRRLLAPAGQ